MHPRSKNVSEACGDEQVTQRGEGGREEKGGTETGSGEIILACSASGVRAGRAVIVKEGHAKKTDGLLPSSADGLIKVGEGDNRPDGGL